VVFLIVSLILMWRNSREHPSRKLSLMQSSLSGWICVGSVLVLVLLIGQVVSDKQIQLWADNQLYGEMHLLHHVADAPS
ncbi:MAG: hypothetical protein ABI210_04775, partial [Abditibacteriaceae bacterium]